jgi:hypothetical protein
MIPQAVPQLNPQNYYRLPWSLADNAISWLEVTTACNLACEGCYRPKVGGHKTLEEIAEDLAVFKKNRKSDCMSIAGGDPLVHPRIVDIVKMVKAGGWKPIINTNGLAFTPKLLKELKQAGVFGFTFHIDTSQERRDSKVKTEKEHNALRQKFAEMVAAEGGLSCAFNQTVTSDTLDQVPEIVRWARANPKIVHSVVFILYREPKLFGNFDFYARDKKVPLGETYDKTITWGGTRALKAADVVAKIREVEPDYEPSCYLNGTEDATSTKWLIGLRLGIGNQTFGYVTPRFMEVVQQGHRILKKRWLAYSSPKLLSAGRAAAFAFSFIDRGMRRIAFRYLGSLFRHPANLFKGVHMQSISTIQPIDVMPDGRMSMCDGCPDMTVYKGKLYWSCRLEEIKEYGCFVTASPRSKTLEPPPVYAS